MKIGSTTINNCKIGSTQVNEIRIGSTLVWQFSSVDPDAQAFITAAGITNPTQQTAINTLVVSLKANGIWTKMKAIYPFVGGTAFSHKFNLKDPRDLDAAFRLVFSGGWVHSSTGALPNGINAFADTFFKASVNALQNSHHLSYYSRTNSNGTEVEIGAGDFTTSGSLIEIRTSGLTYYRINSAGTYITYSDSDSRAFYLANRTASNVVNGWRNSIKVGSLTTASTALYNQNIFLGAFDSAGNPSFFSTKQCAFSSIGDGLTDTDASNLYTAVQAFQTTLGRSVGPQTVSDADAQAFVTAANIQDQVQADAVNNLVIGLKADGLWTKMKAIYPFVGGDATSHKFNLKNPLDTNAAFRLSFVGGWTHSANGAQPNGTNAYADTFLNYSTSGINAQNFHSAFYINSNSNVGIDYGADAPGSGLFYLTSRSSILGNNARFQTETPLDAIDANSLGYYIGNRRNTTERRLIKNGVLISSVLNPGISPFANLNGYLGALNRAGVASFFTNKRYCFLHTGDALTNLDETNLYTAVQAFNTTLGRQV